MIFDELWWAEREAKKARKRIDEKYLPLLEAAKRKNDDDEYQGILGGLMLDTDINEDRPNSIRTRRLVTRLRKLGIDVPPRPDPLSGDIAIDNDENWDFKYTTGSQNLSAKAEARLTREARKEEREQRHLLIAFFAMFIALVGLIVALITVYNSSR